jgi:hypothetical protein
MYARALLRWLAGRHCSAWSYILCYAIFIFANSLITNAKKNIFTFFENILG